MSMFGIRLLGATPSSETRISFVQDVVESTRIRNSRLAQGMVRAAAARVEAVNVLADATTAASRLVLPPTGADGKGRLFDTYA